MWLILPFVHGAKIILPDNATDATHLCDLINQYKVRVLHAGPALFTGLIQFECFATLESLRLIIGGGQAWQLNQPKSYLVHYLIVIFVFTVPPDSIHATAWKISAQQLQEIDHVSIGSKSLCRHFIE